MAQSMPNGTLSAVGILPGVNGNSDAVEALSRTCSSLQHQVEMLQSSLSGVMNFMSNFASYENQQSASQQRTRHSSTGSTNQDSFCYYPSGKFGHFSQTFVDVQRSHVTQVLCHYL